MKVFALLLLLVFVVLEVKAQGQYVGSKNSDVYHYPSCYWAEQINPENKIWFVNAQDAVNHGYRPCKVCKPPLPELPEPTPTPEPPTENRITVFVIDVIDGDTFDTAEGYRIRLADIDAPEIGETGYLASVEYLELLIEDRIVYLNIDSISVTDPYGRYVCIVFVDYNSTYYMNVNQALVIGGYAVIDDYTNNEFDPTTWNLYYLTPIIPEFLTLTPIIVTLIIATIFVALYKSKMMRM